jgi:type II secretory pathway predicted ATPase ExeA
MLTSHDVDSASPFACLLVGQSTLRRRMKLGALAALDQRIGLHYAMARMTPEETTSYLRHHLTLASHQGDQLAVGQQGRTTDASLRHVMSITTCSAVRRTFSSFVTDQS